MTLLPTGCTQAATTGIRSFARPARGMGSIDRQVSWLAAQTLGLQPSRRIRGGPSVALVERARRLQLRGQPRHSAKSTALTVFPFHLWPVMAAETGTLRNGARPWGDVKQVALSGGNHNRGVPGKTHRTTGGQRRPARGWGSSQHGSLSHRSISSPQIKRRFQTGVLTAGREDCDAGPEKAGLGAERMTRDRAISGTGR
jgi:hypothetical protein